MPYSLKYTKESKRQVLDPDGNVTYVSDFNDCEIRCGDDVYQDNLALAKREAYMGKVEDVYIPYTEAEARDIRDKLLAESDWTQTLDAPIDGETREAYRVYRQALRDIPEQEDFPNTIIWPELPAVTKADPDPVDTAVDVLLGGEN